MKGEHESGPRAGLRLARRVVVKVGSRVLVTRTGKPDTRRIRALVAEISALRRSGKDVIVVSSGAIASGVDALRLRKRPTDLPRLQMAAAVGQVRLMTMYERMFQDEGYGIGQVLLTYDDLQNRTRHLNARNTINALLREDIIPVVNENDVVAVDEIKFGDNDLLASLVTVLIEADLLLLLSTTNGLRRPGKRGTVRVPLVDKVTDDVLRLASGKGSQFSSGGMESKLQSAGKAATVGASVVIADGRQELIISRIFDGEDVGTLIGGGSRPPGSVAARKKWIAFFQRSNGAIVIDEGAEKALKDHSHSLLPVGIRDVLGEFPKGAAVRVETADGRVIAHGLVDYSSDEIRKIMGKPTREISGILGSRDYDEVIHRDNMVVLTNGEAT